MGLRVAGLAAAVLLGAVAPASAGQYQAVMGGYFTPGCDATFYFSAGMTGVQQCSNVNDGPGWEVLPDDIPTVGGGATGEWQVNAPAGLSIATAFLPTISDINLSSGHGWQAASYWQGGSDVWAPHTGSVYDSPNNSSYYGFKLYCYASNCPGLANPGSSSYVVVDNIDLTVQENQGPSLVADTNYGNNLWYESGRWVWNPAGDPWSIELYASDPSGVCNMSADAGGHAIPGPSSQRNPNDGFQVCPSPVDWSPSEGAQVDTNQLVSPGTPGTFPLVLSATNAAQLTSSVSENISVDNVRPSVALSTPNDSTPGAWVSHAVTVASSASAGPSGVGGQICSIDGAAARGYSAPLSVNGDGVHTVACTAWNTAVDPQGNANTGSATIAVHIDQAPPSLSFEPEDPNAPTDLVVDTSDRESGVAGGSIAIAPAGTQSWTNLSTSFDGQHLLAQVNDAGLHGPYVIRATSCDNVGNCASGTKTLAMPLRISAESQVSFSRISAPSIVVRKRVLVGWHWRRLRINGHVVRVRLGGHLETVRVVIGRNARCAGRRVRVGPHRWRDIRACRQRTVRLTTDERVGHGHPVTVNGVLVSSEGVPIAGAQVRILTSPTNGLNQFTQVGTVTTGADGAWSAKLSPGPSRTIAAVYGGSGAVLPASGEVTVSVPARIALSVAPRHTSWGGTITLRGQVEGGYVPPAGELVLLWVGWHGGKAEIGHLYTAADGSFEAPYTFLHGNGTASYTLWAATARESDYPYTPARSRRIAVTVGSG